ncbi:MAG: cytidylyltransferase domain-containing protein [bacterium]
MSTAALALILARAGSKGVPGKNVIPIAGRPCIAWTIAHAHTARLVHATAVSTDGTPIADAARAAGAEVLTRPPELAGDTITVDAAARHALHTWESTHDTLSDDAPIVILYANVPIRPPGLIDNAIELLTSTNAHSVQSYTPVGKHHPWWTVRIDNTGTVQPWQGDVLYHNVFRRQDLPPAHIPDGGVLVVTRRSLLLQIPGVPDGPHRFLGLDRRGILTPPGSVVDIDTPLDVHVARAMMQEQTAHTHKD